MQFRYTLIENNEDPVVETVVPDPIGWDTITFAIERHPEYHGFFNGIDADMPNLQFYNQGRDIIKTAFDTYGHKANIDIKIEIFCEDWQEIFYGALDFNTYQHDCGLKGCFASVKAMKKSCIDTFNNRIDQSVDISTLEGFDGASLSPYTYIDYSLTLPGKAIKQDYAGYADPFTHIYCDSSAAVDTACMETAPYVPITGLSYSHYWQYFLPIETETSITDGINNADFYLHQENDPDTLIEYAKVYPGIYQYNGVGSLICTNTVVVNFKASGDFIDDTFNSRIVQCFASIVVQRSLTGIGEVAAVYEIVNGSFSAPETTLFNFDLTAVVTLNPGDKIFCIFSIPNYTYTTAPVIFTQITWDFDTYEISLSSISECQDTVCEVSLINEALSRVTEAITNDCLRVYSQYFGRPDAQPYPNGLEVGNGCGAFEVVTNGLKIRQVKLQNGQVPKHTISFKDLIRGLNCIHNVGYGLETDPNRSGYELLRVEPFAYFYQDSEIFSANFVPKLKTSIAIEKNYSRLLAGYAKWEAEENGGQDDFHGKREYRVDNKVFSATLDRVSNLIASGYSIEATRRKNGTNNADWRYDNDTFIICVEAGDDGLQVELNNTNSEANFYSPQTTYNKRISPVRNAMRWAKTMLQGVLPIIPSTILKFLSGDGNLVAEYRVIDTCAGEAIVVAENSDIIQDLYDSVQSYSPILYNIIDEFEYPLTYSEYLSIVNNPYGYVSYDCGGENFIGYIKKLSYKPVDGKAVFQLIRGYGNS